MVSLIPRLSCIPRVNGMEWKSEKECGEPGIMRQTFLVEKTLLCTKKHVHSPVFSNSYSKDHSLSMATSSEGEIL